MNKLKSTNILLVEDNPGDARLIKELLREAHLDHYEITHEESLAACISRISDRTFDVIVLDLNLPDSQGIDTLSRIQFQDSSTPIVVLTGLADDQVGISAVNAGAQDYLLKDGIDAKLLGRSLRYAIKRSQANVQTRYQAALIENILDAIIATDMDYRITSWNEAAEKTYGWKSDQVLGELLSEKLSPEYANASRDQVIKSFVEDGAWQGEVIHHHKDGTALHIFGSVSLLKDNNNNPIGVVSVNRDITKQKRIAQKLEESEKRYRTLAEAAQDFIFIINRDLQVQYVNRFGARVFGKQPENLIGKSFEALFPHSADRQAESLRQVFQTGEAIYRENPFEFPGQTRWLGTRLSPIQGADGETSAVLGLARDISERRSVEAALEKSEALYQDLYNNAPDMYVSVDASTGRIVQCNHTLETATGYSREEIIGRPLLEMYHHDSLESAKEVFHTFVTTGEILDTELQLRRADGSKIDVSLNVSAVRDDQGKVLFSRSSWRDITERKQMELALQEYSERLEEMVADRTRDLEAAQDQLVRQEKLTILGQLSGGLAHELRTPLNTIKNAASFIPMVLSDPDADTLEMLELLNNAVTNSDRIITSLLTFARPNLPLRQTINLADLIRNAIANLTIPTKILVQIDLAKLPEIISADPNHLEIVFTNLIRNALQAMSEGGQLTIEGRSLNGLETQPESVSVVITDTGVGIPPENIPRMFEPLFSTKIKGIGLGLAISKMLVEGHQGTIAVESEPGMGSTFCVFLPIKSSDHENSIMN